MNKQHPLGTIHACLFVWDMKVLTMRFLKFMLGISAFFLLSGCSAGGLDEVYTAAGDTQEFIFSPDGTVSQSLMGEKVAEFKYERDGNEVKIFINENTATTWTIQEDGSISDNATGVTMFVKE